MCLWAACQVTGYPSTEVMRTGHLQVEVIPDHLNSISSLSVRHSRNITSTHLLPCALTSGYARPALL